MSPTEKLLAAADLLRADATDLSVRVADLLVTVAESEWCCEECKFEPENRNDAELWALSLAEATLAGAA